MRESHCQKLLLTSRHNQTSCYPVFSMWWRHCQHSCRSLFLAVLIMHNGKSPPQSTWSMFANLMGLLHADSTATHRSYSVCSFTLVSVHVSMWLCTQTLRWSTVQWSKCLVVNGQWYNRLSMTHPDLCISFPPGRFWGVLFFHHSGPRQQSQ